MRPITIARNYAEALFALGEKSGRTELYADLLDAMAAAIEAEPRIQGVLMSPRVPKQTKARMLAAAMPEAPKEYVLFLQAVVKRNRQALLRDIADAYLGLLDLKLNRVRAGVTLAREANEAMRQSILDGLRRVLGKEVIPSFRVEPEILGGVVVRVGDRVYDGSLRRKTLQMRRQLLAR
ncbi:MAG: ATP synthase F1 subunit delta [Gemmatimonadales bacterium]